MPNLSMLVGLLPGGVAAQVMAPAAGRTQVKGTLVSGKPGSR